MKLLKGLNVYTDNTEEKSVMYKSKKKILVIDDEISIRFILEKILKQDFDVICLPNGQEGLEYLEAGNFPDMIISDLQMPEM
ncbi:MAG: response regulator, partial [Bacteroidales bacterium]|nr:response regulator [Bacteroidales bacterium]